MKIIVNLIHKLRLRNAGHQPGNRETYSTDARERRWEAAMLKTFCSL